MPNEKTILVLNLTRMGDLLQTTPLINGLRRKYPDHRIILAVNIRFEGILDHFDDFDEKICLDLKQFGGSEGNEYNIVDLYRYFDSFIDVLTARSYDIAVNISHSPFSGLLLSLVKANKFCGILIGEEKNRVIKGNWVKYFGALLFHRTLNRINLVDIYCNAGETRSHTTKLLCKIDEPTFGERLEKEFGIQKDDLVIGFQAGSSRTGRRWKKEYFGFLGNMLIDKLGAKVCLLGVKEELEILEDVNRIMEGRGIMLAGKTNLRELGAFLKRADFLVTNDTGTMHIASAVGTKIIALFLGHAYPYETGPYCEGAAVLMPRIECFPCSHSIECPDDVCTQDVTPHQVFEIIEKTGKKERIDFDSLELPKFASSILLQSVFEERNYVDYLPLGKEPLTEHVYFGILYKSINHHSLGVGEPPVYAISPEEISALKDKIARYATDPETKERFLARFGDYSVRLEAVLDRGIQVSTDMIGLLQQRPVPVGTIKNMSASLVEVDRDIRELREVYEVFSPIVSLFNFDVEELEGNDPLHLTKTTREIYRRTKERLLFMKRLSATLS